MRRLLALPLLLLLSAALAGCLQSRGTLEIDLVVSDQGDIGQFRTINLTLKDVRLEARSATPPPVPVQQARLELVTQANGGRDVVEFAQDVQADKYTRVALTVPAGSSFEGILNDGTKVAMVVPNDQLVQTANFDVPRGGTVHFRFTIEVHEENNGVGQPSFFIRPQPETSGVEAA
jgi:hypothetical protein